MPTDRARALLVAALLVLAGCAARRSGPEVAPPERWMPVERSDFPGGDARGGTPSTRGSAVLRAAARAYREIAGLVEQHGVPDAIAVDRAAARIEIAYAEERAVYGIRETSVPVIPLILSVTRVAVETRPLSDAEFDFVDPEKRLVYDSERLEQLIAAYGRLLTIARRVMLALPPEAAGPGPGFHYGFLTVPVSKPSARLFALSPEAPGVLVAWVDAAGPAGGDLRTGDRILEVDGVDVTKRSDSERKPGEPHEVRAARGDEQVVFRIAPERWARNVTFTPLPTEMPNAFAVEGMVAVTTGLLDLLDDDEVAVVVGHELGHVVLGHVERKVTPGSVLKGVVGLGVLLPADLVLPGAGQALGGVLQGVENRFNRDQERDADRWGVRLAARAGYDPRAAVTLMDDLEREAPVGALAQFFSAHPPYPERRDIVREEIEKVERDEETETTDEQR